MSSHYMDFSVVLANVLTDYMEEIGLLLAHLNVSKNAKATECLFSTVSIFISSFIIYICSRIFPFFRRNVLFM